MGILGGGRPPAPPSEVEWSKLTFIEKLDFAVKDVSLNGRGVPNLFLIWHAAMWLLNYVGFFIIWRCTPQPEGMSKYEYAYQTFIRCTVWHHLLEAHGIARQGPLYGYFVGPINWRFRLTPGTMKEALLPCLGSTRTYIDVAVHALFFASCLLVVFLPQFPVRYVWVIVACDAWCIISDFSQWMAGVGHTYTHMLFAASFPLSQGSFAALQTIMIIQWISSGAGKMGPWFTNVNGPFMIQSIWLRGSKWFHSLIFQGTDNLSPTKPAHVLSYFAASVEWGCPLLLLAPNTCVVYVGVIGLMCMHLYIVGMPAPFDVYQWNTYFAICCIYLFTRAHVGFDYNGFSQMSLVLKAYLLVETCVVIAGHFLPNHISFYVCHRYWAGNWSQSFILLKKDAIGKLSSLNSCGRPAWDPLPEKLKSKVPPMQIQFSTFKALAYLWIATLNTKILPTLVEKARGSHPIEDFFLAPGLSLMGMFQGQIVDQMRVLKFTQNLGKFAHLAEGDCTTIFIQSFPLCGGQTSWKIVDAVGGTIAEGKLTLEQCHAIGSLPSACEKLSSLLEVGKV